MNEQAALGWRLIIAGVVLTIVSNAIDDKSVRVVLSGLAACVAVAGAVILWQARRAKTRSQK